MRCLDSNYKNIDCVEKSAAITSDLLNCDVLFSLSGEALNISTNPPRRNLLIRLQLIKFLM